MKHVSHPSNTRTLQPPKAWDHDAVPCDALPITDMVAGGLPCLVSFWKPEPAELEAIAAGRPVVLSIMGGTMPPVALAVEAPPTGEPALAEPSPTAQEKAFDAFLCRAWGETELPSAELAHDWEGVRRFLIREWLGEEDEEALLQAKDDFEQYEEDMGTNGGPFSIEFEIGGISIERVVGFAHGAAAVEAKGALDARSDMAISAVLTERRRQIGVKGWTPEHDDTHVNDEIAAMACFYAMPPGAREWPATETGYGHTLGAAIVPQGWETKEGDRIRELSKAGALILAELGRLYRAQAAGRPA